jgi:multicomponent K+:H+ antiporter subunit A
MLILLVLAPFVGALLPALLARRRRTDAAWLAGSVAAFGLFLLFAQAPAVFSGEHVAVKLPWMPELGLALAFRLDGLGFMFALLVLGIGLLVILYARYYLSEKEPMGRFYGLLLLFMGSMLGLVLADNLLLLALFWELTSLSSFLLIGFWKDRADARQGARLALMITGGGGLALLAGVLLLGQVAGSYELSEVLAAGDTVRADPLYPVILVLVLLGAFTKSAQFPFHFWLPHAMAAPTPISAYLHSATMVKAGVFLLARFFPVLAGTDLWFFLVTGTGLVTVLFAAYTALFQHDLKGLLAYSTISHLGLVTMLFGLGSPLGAIAGVFHILNHATFKASLFMAAGIIDHEAGTRDMRRLNGMFKYMPHTAVLAMVAASAMAGVPLLNGFLSKEMFFGETLHLAWLGGYAWVVPTVATLAGVFSVAYSARFIHDVFFNGEPIDLPRTPHEPPRWMLIPVEVLVALCLAVGIVPALVVGDLLHVAAGAVLGNAPIPEYHLKIWHGFNLPLLMSTMASLGGIAVYASRNRLFELHDLIFPPISGKGLTEDYLGGVIRWARRLTESVENGSVQRSIALLIVTSLAVGMVPFWRVPVGDPATLSSFDVLSAIAFPALAFFALVTAAMHRRRLLALLSAGVVGLIVALIFVRLSAPDLALTQLLVEVVTAVLILLALNFFPRHLHATSTPRRQFRDVLLAAGGGVGVGALTWMVTTRPLETISGYHLENSLPGGGGANVVNVILVDFRGFDTLGEATVLAIAAFAIFALLRGFRLPRPRVDWRGEPWSSEIHPLILVKISRPLLALALLVGLYLLLRGHNAPGGGFIAGLVVATALVLQHLASGSAWAVPRLGVDQRALVGAGLLLAGLTGVGSWFFQAPFLTSTFDHVHLPLLGDVELASAMAFDLGVFLAVVGTVVLVLSRLGAIGYSPGVEEDGG